MAVLAVNALCVVSDVKESMGIASSDKTKDNLITRKINQVSQQLETYCSRVFRVIDYVETYNGSDIDELVLNQRPVNTFTTLEYRMTEINTDNWITINSTFYYIDNSAGIIKLLYQAPGRWYRWRATYNAGYATIPPDLVEACISLVTFYVNNAAGVHVALSTLKEGQRELQYSRMISTLTFEQIMAQLGVDQLVKGYANWPLRSE